MASMIAQFQVLYRSIKQKLRTVYYCSKYEDQLLDVILYIGLIYEHCMTAIVIGHQLLLALAFYFRFYD